MTAPVRFWQTSFWRAGALPAAAGSVGSLLAQALLALFLLRLFEPAAVGLYAVVAQIAFGWATLALAQSPLSLLANPQQAALSAGRLAWRQSALRWLLLAPLALGALWWSQARTATQGAEPLDGQALGWVLLGLWTAAIALAQLSALLAQSLALRVHGPLSVAAVRLLPALLAAAWAGLCALLWQATQASSLLGAALLGYLAGALWLWPLLGGRIAAQQADTASHTEPTATGSPASVDARSERLKFVHTLSDVLVATLLASHWARLHGAAEAACLLLLLRLLGFVPALVSSAWAQVVLSRPRAQRPGSWAAVLGAALGLGLLAATLWLALQMGWLPAAWQGLQTYLWPLLLWQLAASAMAALSHRPFRFGQARRYTGQCLAINAGQALLVLAPPLWGWGLSTQLWALSLWLSTGLGLQALWAARLR